MRNRAKGSREIICAEEERQSVKGRKKAVGAWIGRAMCISRNVSEM